MAETRLRQLSRHPPNLTCPNCGHFSKTGFSTICVKFGTFICNDCKSSHQAISHRCKSLTMSRWTQEEVEDIKGNEVCRRTWLRYAPEFGRGGRPRPGDGIGVFKSFVVEVYERKRYYGEDNEEQSGSVATAVNTAAKPTKAPAAVSMDLLDFSSPTEAASPNASANAFASDFGDFQAAQVKNPNTSAAAFTADFGDSSNFGDFQAAPVSSTPAPPPPKTASPAMSSNTNNAMSAPSMTGLAPNPSGMRIQNAFDSNTIARNTNTMPMNGMTMNGRMNAMNGGMSNNMGMNNGMNNMAVANGMKMSNNMAMNNTMQMGNNMSYGMNGNMMTMNSGGMVMNNGMTNGMPMNSGMMPMNNGMSMKNGMSMNNRMYNMNKGMVTNSGMGINGMNNGMTMTNGINNMNSGITMTNGMNNMNSGMTVTNGMGMNSNTMNNGMNTGGMAPMASSTAQKRDPFSDFRPFS